MQNIDINQAKKRLPELVEKTISGDEIIITKGGQPIAKLVGIPKREKQRQFGTAKGLIKISDDFDKPLEDFQGYM
ncbi:MAG: type II toxin-antitoxin system Phd/YefM family antitoxin [Proteobacteria bacterium]|jgi:prevent-host-death family protein|nr:type II toxin-antitoxin system Phd/YefM family antitoxin [Pseudomonadota bacterium]